MLLKRVLFTFATFAMVFGLLGIGMMSHEMQFHCPFSAVMGVDCTSKTMTDNGAMVLHHLEMLKDMSTATVSAGILALLSLFVAISLFAWLALRIVLRRSTVFSLAYPHGRYRYKESSPRRLALFWAALHNKYGDLASFRMRGVAVMS